MIEILKDKTYVKDADSINTEAFCVFENDTKLGCSICKFEPENVEILCMEFVNDLYEKMFSDGLVRTILNAADLRAIPTGICRDKKYFEVLTEIGFSEDTDKNIVYIDIAEFFKQGCKK